MKIVNRLYFKLVFLNILFCLESFVVCKNFALPEGYQLNLTNPLLHNTNFDWNSLEGINRYVIPFMCCGDLSAFDSDKGDMLKVRTKNYSLKNTGCKEKFETIFSNPVYL